MVRDIPEDDKTVSDDATETREEYVELLDIAEQEEAQHEAHRWHLADLMSKRDIAGLGRRVENALVDVIEATPHFDDLELPEKMDVAVLPDDRVDYDDDRGLDDFDPEAVEPASAFGTARRPGVLVLGRRGMTSASGSTGSSCTCPRG
mgnify:CR=1 FL=1